MGLLSWVRNRNEARLRDYVGRIETDLFGFVVVQDGLIAAEFSFSEVTAMIAYKRDLLTVDLICIDVLAGERFVCVNEDMGGYDRFIERASELPGFRQDWWSAVAFPPFAECSQVIFRQG